VRTQTFTLPLPEVVSVLPPEGQPVEPRPPKSLRVPPAESGLPWWWWLVLLALLLAALLAYWLTRKPREVTPEPALDPREWALAQLDDQELQELARRGDLPEFFRRVSRVVRTYAYRVRPELSPDLTSTELIARLARSDAPPTAIARLSELLRSADRVKFARYLPAGAEAQRFVDSTREWILGYPQPPTADEEPRRAA
jgi:hypothetical protein